VNQKDKEWQTPLHYASLCEQVEIASLLLKARADPTIRDKEGETPADSAPPAILKLIKVK